MTFLRRIGTSGDRRERITSQSPPPAGSKASTGEEGEGQDTTSPASKAESGITKSTAETSEAIKR